MTLTERLEAIEAGYEFSLAYAAQGRTDESGSQIRQMLETHACRSRRTGAEVEAAVSRAGATHATSTRRFVDAVRQDAVVAQGAIGLVLDAPALGSLLVDNLNATIHLRALLTDLFLIDQARKAKIANQARVLSEWGCPVIGPASWRAATRWPGPVEISGCVRTPRS